MEQISVMGKIDVSDRLTVHYLDEKFLSSDRQAANPIMENILSEGGDDFFQYLNWTGLAKEPNLMVLSSMHHYYYDHNDLQGIRTLINLKRLNQVRHIESFLHTLYRILPSGSYFIGCFRKNDRYGSGTGFQMPARFFTNLAGIFDSRTERSMSKNSVTKLLEEHGFKVNDFTDINGMTYFCAQSLRRQCE
ncbi:MAG TPA: hypothetical protein DEO60_01690 [Bacteroidales bacterium]|nr:hypothetical protein [Bacteroidales bacterium]HBZ19815.1 hypothetical protein [Bacteroidales bacterium]